MFEHHEPVKQVAHAEDHGEARVHEPIRKRVTNAIFRGRVNRHERVVRARMRVYCTKIRVMVSHSLSMMRHSTQCSKRQHFPPPRREKYGRGGSENP